MKANVSQFFLFVILAVVLLSAAGCKTDESANTSVRPWNAPQGWEAGSPLMNSQR